MRKNKDTEPAPQTAAGASGTAVRVPFEELIAGEYREEFRAKLDEALAGKRGDEEAARRREYSRLIRSAEAARRVYPGLDLRQELASPRFAALVAGGADVQAAYEATHHEELLREAMAYSVRRTAERMAGCERKRPSENGADGQSVSVSRTDPRKLTRQEREELRRRVLEQGERIVF